MSESNTKIYKEEFSGVILKHRFIIDKIVGEGNQGSVYKVIDFEFQKRPLVIKIF